MLENPTTATICLFPFRNQLFLYIASVTHSSQFLLALQGKLDEVDALLLRVVEIDEKNFGPDHPRVADGVLTRARLLSKQARAVRMLWEHLFHGVPDTHHFRDAVFQ